MEPQLQIKIPPHIWVGRSGDGTRLTHDLDRLRSRYEADAVLVDFRLSYELPARSNPAHRIPQAQHQNMQGPFGGAIEVLTYIFASAAALAAFVKNIIDIIRGYEALQGPAEVEITVYGKTLTIRDGDDISSQLDEIASTMKRDV